MSKADDAKGISELRASKDEGRPVDVNNPLELACAKAMIGAHPVSWNDNGWKKYQALLKALHKALSDEAITMVRETHPPTTYCEDAVPVTTLNALLQPYKLRSQK